MAAIALCFLVFTHNDTVFGQDKDVTEWVSKFTKELKDENADVRRTAARALGLIGPEAKAAVHALSRALEDEDADVRFYVAFALGEIGPEANAAVPALGEALNDEKAGVREGAAGALGEIGPGAKAAVPALIEALKDEDAGVRYLAADALTQISEDLQDAMVTMPQAELEEAISILAPYESHSGVPAIRRAVTALRAELRSRFWYRFQQSADEALQYFVTQKWPWVVAAYVGLFLLCCVGLAVSPKGLLVANDFLRQLPEAKVKWPIEMTISLRHLLVVGFFSQHKWVLDAWVRRHIESARQNFRELPTVKQREVHVSLPVRSDGKLVADFSAQNLQETFRRRERTCLLINGQGGSGKTSLACQLGKWAIHEDKRLRLTRHPMLPLLIEEELVEGREGQEEAPLVQTARGKLQSLIGEANPVTPEFFIQLLRKKRVVVFVDHLSEMAPATREGVQPQSADFPVGALVVTSRIEEKQLGNKTTLEPILLTGTQVSDFVRGYLQQQGRADFFEDDEEFFESCRRLSRMVGEREITPLFAKLYLDQLTKAKESGSTVRLPENIPDLMLRYLDELHADADLETKRQTQADAKDVAWLCVKDNFLPGAAPHRTVLETLGGKDAQDRLDYLESKLHLVRTEGPRHDQVRFVLDPLVEYLAGLKVVETYKGNSRHWESFLSRADEKELENIQGFLLAMRDCCLTADFNVPDSVVEELGKRGGLDPETVERNRVRQRVKRYTNDLETREPKDRIHACQTLGEIGRDAKAAVPALSEALKDEEKSIRRSAADALGRIGPEAKAAVRALSEALKDEDGDVRHSAAVALGDIGREAKAAVHALIEALKYEDPAVRGSAAVALGRIGPEAKAAVPALIEALKHKNVFVRWYATCALGDIGPEAKAAVSALSEALKEKDADIRRRAADALVKIGPAAVPAFSAALKEKDSNDRGCAAAALVEIGPAAVPTLVEALKDEDAVVRRSAAFALGGIGAGAKAAVPALTDALKDKVLDVRWYAADALAKIGSAAVLALIKALKDEDINVRRLAARTLGKIGPGTKAAVSALIEALMDEDEAVRGSAALALGRSGPGARAAVPALTKALKDEDAGVRGLTTVALGKIGPEAQAAVPALSEALTDEDINVRRLAADALGQVGPEAKAAVPALSEALKQKDPYIRRAAGRALGKIDSDGKAVGPSE